MEIKLPEIGEGTAEGEIIKWLVAEGETVEEDTPLVEVMTDKATVEIPAPFPGTVLELRAQEGEVVDVGAVIMMIDQGEAGESREANEPAIVSEPEEPIAAAAPAETVELDGEAVAAARAMARAELDIGVDETPVWEVAGPPGGGGMTTPATRRMARELGIDVRDVVGSGKGGRVTKADLVRHGDRVAAPPSVGEPAAVTSGADTEVTEPREPEPTYGSSTTSGSSSASVSEVAPAKIAPPRLTPVSDGPLEERVPVRGLRRLIAERLAEAKRLIPHFTYVEECDMTEIVALRREAKEMAAAQGVRVTYLPFLIKALVEACRRHPILNSTFDEASGEIVLKRYYNIGVATDTSRGLMVPMVKNADRLSIFELAQEIERISADARAGQSAADDLQGGTITITSTGSIGGLLATPIINHPEVAILGVPAIRKRPVVRGDEIVIRDMVNLSLSADHRVVDGAPAAQFTRDLVALLEDPKLQLLAP